MVYISIFQLIPPFEMYKILLVEDSEINRQLVQRRLASETDYVIGEAVDGKSGVEIAFHHQPDLILMDMSLPVKDGWEATRELRQFEQTKDIPIIALTAHCMESDREKSIEVGCDEVVCKPIDFVSLKLVMARLLNKNRPNKVLF